MKVKDLIEQLKHAPGDAEVGIEVGCGGEPCITGPFKFVPTGVNGPCIIGHYSLNPSPIWAFTVTGQGCEECGKDDDVVEVLLKPDPDVPGAYETLFRCFDCQ